MNNYSTKEQIRAWLQKAVEDAKKPNRRAEIRKQRELRAKKVSKRYGL